ncbi:NUDIX hydrolase [Cellulomonas dongxiuzhuiae]|uniref:NUDIX hydrolase n=1 Tax=Cellulomonas dongxiuzhuiae TaxID=2819979 RepID=A0ABX8GGU5_9CELL|nr:NUDIX hydrolase [Cellulomonas dongxiuzhuiae]QWC15092.1 NUDIX hydrolase [Cellulomonas dongxiuzhuiae]
MATINGCWFDVNLTRYGGRVTLPGYDPADFPPFAVTVDLVVLTLRGGELHVLLVERGAEPWRGHWALPGGFVRPDEGLDAAAERELAEETGVHDVPGHLEQLASYGDPGRDPRMRVVSVAYLALAPDLPEPRAGTDAAQAAWVPVVRAQREALAFDHARILADGLERARAKLEYSSLATAFCGPEFTIGDLRRVYEAVWGATLDPRNFHRKLTGVPGLLVDTGRTRTEGRGRPATVYRRGDVTTLHPPLTRD